MAPLLQLHPAPLPRTHRRLTHTNETMRTKDILVCKNLRGDAGRAAHRLAAVPLCAGEDGLHVLVGLRKDGEAVDRPCLCRGSLTGRVGKVAIGASAAQTEPAWCARSRAAGRSGSRRRVGEEAVRACAASAEAAGSGRSLTRERRLHRQCLRYHGCRWSRCTLGEECWRSGSRSEPRHGWTDVTTCAVLVRASRAVTAVLLAQDERVRVAIGSRGGR